MKRGKNYKAAAAKIDPTKTYSYDEAIKLVKELSFAKFDETIDLSVKLQLKKSQTVRDTLVLPHQFKAGKKILVFAKGDKAKEAEEAGAAYVGDIELVDKVKGGWLDFDICVATPDMMKDVGKLGQILGRRGMMPNPKTGTVTMDVKNAVAELQKGRVEFRADKTGVVSLSVGKVSMDDSKIKDNIALFVDELLRKKPSDAKGDFVNSIAISSTMGPGVRVVLKAEE